MQTQVKCNKNREKKTMAKNENKRGEKSITYTQRMKLL